MWNVEGLAMKVLVMTYRGIGAGEFALVSAGVFDQQTDRPVIAVHDDGIEGRAPKVLQ
jgi:hypothetical protein